ncbi:hypothetical protein [Streptomyces durocortorensis]|uniref:HEPN domain-containing protein n=1 Tax=Streptomyces durocortorensis TaxID=2811104 RepID=A0ABS2HX43_9ACTN|nr:hypothetical protein [Streptomyces durocortorensis]MBM7054097.1 hypothetical protein [Streptomyces durocortorensis]
MDEAEDRLSLPRPRWANAEIAVWGGVSEDDLTLAGGYLRVAETAARHWIVHGPDDRMPLPILYNYRHSIELSLKWLIRKAAQCALREGYTGEEDLSSDQLDKRLHTHNIRKLADCLNRYLALLDLPKVEQRIDPGSWSQLKWLDSEDASGETYRYAVVGHGTGSAPARPVQQNVNFYEQVNELHKLAHLLWGGYSAHLGEYENWQIEYMEAMGTAGY